MNEATRGDILDTYIDATRHSVDEAELDQAVARFRNSLPPRQAGVGLPRTAAFRWGIYVALSVMAIAVVPLFFSQGINGVAFAQAQQWFERYHTLHIVMTMKQEERTVNRIEAWSDAEAGAMRINVQSTSYIFDSDATVHLLMPGNRVISYTLDSSAEANGVRDQFAWLAQLRDFQGQARALDETRDIDGIQAVGFQLGIAEGIFTLWVDPRDNRPLLLTGTLPAGLLFDARLEFDQALPTGTFEVPANYVGVTP